MSFLGWQPLLPILILYVHSEDITRTISIMSNIKIWKKTMNSNNSICFQWYLRVLTIDGLKRMYGCIATVAILVNTAQACFSKGQQLHRSLFLSARSDCQIQCAESYKTKTHLEITRVLCAMSLDESLYYIICTTKKCQFRALYSVHGSRPRFCPFSSFLFLLRFFYPSLAIQDVSNALIERNFVFRLPI